MNKNHLAAAILYVFIAYFIGPLNYVRPDANDKQYLSQCTAAMAPPLQFRITTSSGIDLIISRGYSPTKGYIARIEYAIPTMRKIVLHGDKGVFEFYPDSSNAFDVNFRRDRAEGFLREYIDCGESALDVRMSKEDAMSRWLTYELDDKRVTTLRVNKASNLLEEKKISDQSSVVVRDFKYSDIVRNAKFEAMFFDVPTTATIQVMKSNEEAAAMMVKLTKHSVPFVRTQIPPPRKDPDTGILIAQAPAGQEAEFDKLVSDKIAKNIAARNAGENETAPQTKQSLPEKSTSNSERIPPKSTDSLTAPRGSSMWWIAPGLIIFAILCFVFSKRQIG